LIKPDQVRPQTNRKWWFQCPVSKTNEYETALYNRTGSGSGCPICVNQLIIEENSLQAVFPEIAAQWHARKNAPLLPSQIAPKSSRVVWWQCPIDRRHQWQSSPSDRSSWQPDCPQCRVAAQTFAAVYPEIAEYWHPTKNGKIKPDMVKPRDPRPFWWICKEYGHAWRSKIMRRVEAKTPCKVCYNLQLRPGNMLADLFPALVPQWHPTKNKDLTPNTVSAFSSRAVYWICPVRKHVWLARIGNRTANKSGCPHCLEESWRRKRMGKYPLS